MTNVKTKLTTALATGAVLFNAVVPAFAATTTIEISGNGSHTENEVEIEREVETGVFQDNDTTIVNDISVKSNTGDNTASDNTGGDVEVRTGNAEISAEIVNQANTNYAEVEPCDCETETEIKVSENGSGSENEVEVETKNKNNVVQDNSASIENLLDFDADSGNNETDDNTGGEVKVRTGNVKIAPVRIANLAGVNSAVIGGGAGDHDGSVLGLKIVGNGSDSENEIEVENEHETGIFQTNDADILNDLQFDGNSGDNRANDNTGDGYTDPSIVTGDVTIKAYVDNAAGFNMAEADCGCVLDVMGSIMGNGTESESEIELELEDELEVSQDNVDSLVNTGEIMSDTGENEADDNTAGEVAVHTGDTETVIETANMGGTNAFGAVQIDLPFGMSFVFGL